MEKKNKKSILLIFILTIVTLAISVGGTYAYFQAQISQGVNSRVSITAVNGITINFNNGNGFNMGGIIPGEFDTKTITVSLNNQKQKVDEVYNIKLHITSNTFGDEEGKLKYTITGTGLSSAKSEEIPDGNNQDISILSNVNINGVKGGNPVTHTYQLKLEYPNDTTREQKQGGSFDGYIYMTTGREAVMISFTIDGSVYFEGASYSVPDGTTWREFASSVNNTARVLCSTTLELIGLDKNGDNFCDEPLVFEGTENFPSCDDTIVSGARYSLADSSVARYLCEDSW